MTSPRPRRTASRAAQSTRLGRKRARRSPLVRGGPSRTRVVSSLRSPGQLATAAQDASRDRGLENSPRISSRNARSCKRSGSSGGPRSCSLTTDHCRISSARLGATRALEGQRPDPSPLDLDWVAARIRAPPRGLLLRRHTSKLGGVHFQTGGEWRISRPTGIRPDQQGRRTLCRRPGPSRRSQDCG